MAKIVSIELAPLLVLLVAISLRTYPFLATGMPFSGDGWYHIRNAQAILTLSPTPLEGADPFDSYHIYWPAISVYGAVIQLVTSLPVIHGLAFFAPFASSFSSLILYILVGRLTGSRFTALAASLFLSAWGFNAIKTAGVTKETYAYPLLVLTLYFFAMVLTGGDRSRAALLSAISFLALLTSHHITTLVLLAVVTSSTAAFYAVALREGARASPTALLVALLMLTLTVAYYELYALRGFPVAFTAMDWLSMAAFQLVIGLGVLYHCLTRRLRGPPIGESIFLAGTVALIFLSGRMEILEGAPVIPMSFQAYAIPYLPILAMAVIGYRSLIRCASSVSRVFTGFWLSSVLALEAYMIFAAEPGMSFPLSFRLLNFLNLPIIILAAVGLSRVIPSLRGGTALARASKRVGSGILLIALAAGLAYPYYGAVALGDGYLGPYNFHSPSDMAFMDWVRAFAPANLTFSADLKYSTALGGYLDRSAGGAGLYLYLAGLRDGLGSGYAVIDDHMRRYGYYLSSAYFRPLPDDWPSRAYGEPRLSLIYSSGLIGIAKVGS